jgi:hypothetical protein
VSSPPYDRCYGVFAYKLTPVIIRVKVRTRVVGIGGNAPVHYPGGMSTKPKKTTRVEEDEYTSGRRRVLTYAVDEVSPIDTDAERGGQVRHSRRIMVIPDKHDIPTPFVERVAKSGGQPRVASVHLSEVDIGRETVPLVPPDDRDGERGRVVDPQTGEEAQFRVGAVDLREVGGRVEDEGLVAEDADLPYVVFPSSEGGE